MATLDYRFRINGLAQTSDSVWENLEAMAEACSTWVTYDTHSGRYAVIINDVGNSVASLTEANILGSMQIAGSGLDNLYNQVEVEYFKAEIRDQPYYYKLSLPGSLRNQYEPDNNLQISNKFINNDVQAQLIGSRTLRQSRLDKTVTILTDYTFIHLQAGDIIDITSDTYGWTAKLWRIMRVREVEGDDGSLRIEFTLIEYDADVYSEEDISEFLSDGVPGIRSITAIGIPGTPTVTVANLNSLPTQSVTSTCPEGIVERMQFWAGNVAATGNVANTEFYLYGVVASTDAASFTAGDSVTYDNNSLPSGTWVWKTRGTNALAVGPFSNESANTDYVRNLAPDKLFNDTDVIYGNGTVLGNSITNLASDTSQSVLRLYRVVASDAAASFAFTDVSSNAAYQNLGNLAIDFGNPVFTGNSRLRAHVFISDSGGTAISSDEFGIRWIVHDLGSGTTAGTIENSINYVRERDILIADGIYPVTAGNSYNYQLLLLNNTGANAAGNISVDISGIVL
jgi:hypothetical protein